MKPFNIDFPDRLPRNDHGTPFLHLFPPSAGPAGIQRLILRKTFLDLILAARPEIPDLPETVLILCKDLKDIADLMAACPFQAVERSDRKIQFIDIPRILLNACRSVLLRLPDAPVPDVFVHIRCLHPYP